MWQSLRYRHWRAALVGTALVFLLVAVMAVDPLRAAAGRFLGVFRVQNFAVIQVPSGQEARLREFKDQVFSEPQFEKKAPQHVNSAAEADKLVNFKVLTPGYLPAAAKEQTRFDVEGARKARSHVNVAAARTLLEASGLDPKGLPADRDSMDVSADIPAGVVMEYGSGKSAVAIIQGPSPKVNVPEDVDMAQLGEVGLRLLGVPADKAEQMAANIDWGTTLVVPVPSDVGAVEERPIRGATGYVMTEKTDKGQHSILFWQENGILYAVGGQLSADMLAQIAESLQ